LWSPALFGANPNRRAQLDDGLSPFSSKVLKFSHVAERSAISVELKETAAMKTLVDALAKIDKVEREISGIHPIELRDAIRGYANAQRELIKALGKFDRPLQLAGPSRQKPKLVVVR
jgi:hypothetical protein